MSYTEYQAYKTKATVKELPLTTPDIEGPFYTPNSPPIKSRLCPGDPTIVISGKVTDQAGNPVPGALLDWWQADEKGIYDNVGFTLRGRMLTDADGCYRLETVRPGHYAISDTEFRCSHLHVKVTPVPGGDTLTTQLYFADDPYDATDHWFDKSRTVTPDGPGKFIFNFVV